MEYNIIINQAALRKWVREINLTDAAIIGFIRALTPDDPAVRHYMLSGYYRLEAGWMKRQLPLLDVSEDWLLRCLKKLKKLGLLDTFCTAGRKKRLKTYGRLSTAYFEAERAARDSLDALHRYAENNPDTGENSDTRRIIRVSENDPDQTPIDHKIKDQCKTDDGAAPSGGAAAVSPEETEKEINRALSNLPPVLRERLLALRTRARRKQQQELPGMGPPE